MNDLTPKQLAARWQMSVGTLANWRIAKRGPAYRKNQGKRGAIRYPLVEVEKYEQTATHQFKQTEIPNNEAQP